MNYVSKVSTLVEDQFPEFYRQEGSVFVQFLEAYYEFLEQEGNPLYNLKNVANFVDPDNTIDQFLSHFKNEFLINFPAITSMDQRFLIKRIKDFYTAKGSEQGLKLLFRLLFDDEITVKYPSRDILKASDGNWIIPIYIETEHNPNSYSLIGSKIIGLQSGASGFVENVRTVLVNQKLSDVITLSSIGGNFEFGELVTSDNINSFKVTGSLTQITIIDGGLNNSVGDVFEISSSLTGKKGLAKVTSIQDGTGKVDFTLLSGGSGFDGNSHQVFVSSSVIFYNHLLFPTLKYNKYDWVCQPLNALSFNNFSGANVYIANTLINGYNSTGLVGQGTVVSVTPATNTMIISVSNGSFLNTTSMGTLSNAITMNVSHQSDVTATGYVTDSNTTALGVHSNTNIFYGNGAYTYSKHSPYGTVITQSSTALHIGSGSNATFNIGSLYDPMIVQVLYDKFIANNVNNIPFLTMVICGSNSNTGLVIGSGNLVSNTSNNNVTLSTANISVGSGLYSNTKVFIGTVNAISNSTHATLSSNALLATTSGFYYNSGQLGFPLSANATMAMPMSAMLAINTIAIGAIDHIAQINPGEAYDANPFVAIRNPYTVSYSTQNAILTLSNRSGGFAVNNMVTQLYPVLKRILNFANSSGFVYGEGVTQSNGTANAYGTIESINATSITVGTLKGSDFVSSNVIVGLQSNHSSNLVSFSNASANVLAKGIITQVISPTVIEVEMLSLHTGYVTNTAVLSSIGGVANVISSVFDASSAYEGYNANTSAVVSIGKGIVKTLDVIDSGFGYQPNDILTLTNNTNMFPVTGYAIVQTQGIGSGYWEDNAGKLNVDKYIIDGDYYQDFSYEISSRLSLDKYADILKKTAHISGTKLFGKVAMNSTATIDFIPVPLNITIIGAISQ
jgi:hypothetical protein